MQEDQGRKMLVNLFNIQKTAFGIGRNPINLEMVNNFDETTRRIDSYDNKEYKKKIASLLTISSNIEEELERLSKLIVLINDRVEKRNTLAKEYNKATGRIIEFLENIEGADDIFAYKQRYNNIKKYLDATTKSKSLEEDLVILKKELEDKLKIKELDEKENIKLENDLEEKFTLLYNDYLIVNNIDKYNIDTKIEEVKMELRESLSSLNAFELAYNAIKSSVPIDELTKYNKDAYDFKVNYYNMKVKDIVVRIYKLILTPTKPNYDSVLLKRNNIKDIINELYLVKSKYMIYEENLFKDLIYYINEQNEEIVKECNTINEISKLEEKIEFKEERIFAYKCNLEEYGVIKIMDEYVNISNNVANLNKNQVKEEVVKYQDNEILNASSFLGNININEVKKKTDDVLKRVSELLGINKIDKKVEAPIFKPIMVNPVTKDNNEEVKEKKEDIFNNNLDDIFVQDKVIKANDEEIFFEMPTLPINNVTSGRYNENDFPF